MPLERAPMIQRKPTWHSKSNYNVSGVLPYSVGSYDEFIPHILFKGLSFPPNVP